MNIILYLLAYVFYRTVNARREKIWKSWTPQVSCHPITVDPFVTQTLTTRNKRSILKRRKTKAIKGWTSVLPTDRNHIYVSITNRKCILRGRSRTFLSLYTLWMLPNPFGIANLGSSSRTDTHWPELLRDLRLRSLSIPQHRITILGQISGYKLDGSHPHGKPLAATIRTYSRYTT